jgi:hypothetical protein
LTKRLIILGYHENLKGFRNSLPWLNLWSISKALANYFIWKMKEHRLSAHHLTTSYFQPLLQSYDQWRTLLNPHFCSLQ